MYFKQTIIFLVLLSFFYIIFQLFQQRQQILSLDAFMERNGDFQEGLSFSIPSKNAELTALQITTVSANVTNAKTKVLSLNQYCIKASYNTAFTGNHMNKDMVKYVLQRGCRFLDFEVYPNPEAILDKNLIPTVSCSIVKPQTTETLSDILNTIGSYGFSAPSPVTTDPIFINLRIFSQGNKYLYTQIASVIQKSSINQYLYKNPTTNVAIPIDLNTLSSNSKNNRLLSDIQNKIIILLDMNVASDYNDNTNKCNVLNLPATCVDLVNVVNVVTGNSVLTITYSNLLNEKYNSPSVNDDGITTTVKRFTIVYPDTCMDLFGLSKPTSYVKMPFNYGVQIMEWPFYKNDSNLAAYETAFNKSDGSAFVPMAKMLKYIQDQT